MQDLTCDDNIVGALDVTLLYRVVLGVAEFEDYAILPRREILGSIFKETR